MARNPAGMMRARIHVGKTPTQDPPSKPRTANERLERISTVRKRMSTKDVNTMTQSFISLFIMSTPKLKARCLLSRVAMAPPANAIHSTMCWM